MIEGTPDPNASTFKPVKQRTASKIMYTGDGYLPEDWYFFHSGVNIKQILHLYQNYVCIGKTE